MPPGWRRHRDRCHLVGVSLHRPPPPKPGVASHYTDRGHLDAAFALRQGGVTTTEPRAPATAYWKPSAPGQADHFNATLARVPPGLYRAGESFESFGDPRGEGRGVLAGVVWQRWDTVRHNHGEVDPQAAPGLTRQVARPHAPLVWAQALCPVSGIWQPWVDPAHPLAAAINQHWRQSWLETGQPFPRPELDWLPALPDGLLRWHLMESQA